MIAVTKPNQYLIERTPVPADVALMILGYLDSHSSIRSFSLASRLYVQACQKRLFRHVKVVNAKAASALNAVLDCSQHLEPLIEHLEFKAEDRYQVPWFNKDPNTFAELLSLSHITQLSIRMSPAMVTYWIFLHARVQDSILTALKAPNLISLTLANVAIPLACFSFSPQLLQIKLHEAEIMAETLQPWFHSSEYLEKRGDLFKNVRRITFDDTCDRSILLVIPEINLESLQELYICEALDFLPPNEVWQNLIGRLPDLRHLSYELAEENIAADFLVDPFLPPNLRTLVLGFRGVDKLVDQFIRQNPLGWMIRALHRFELCRNPSALESVCLRIHFAKGCICYTSQLQPLVDLAAWSRFDKILSNTDTFPDLRKLSIVFSMDEGVHTIHPLVKRPKFTDSILTNALYAPMKKKLPMLEAKGMLDIRLEPDVYIQQGEYTRVRKMSIWM